MTSEEHDSAVQSLNAALVEQDRLSERYDAAIGTSTELSAYVRLRAAGDQVAARGAWLSWIDDEGYRGLNAGPFELLAESDRGLGRAIEARLRELERANRDAEARLRVSDLAAA
jgi:hypothetical protein